MLCNACWWRFQGKRLKGIRWDCPAAVSRNEHPNTTGYLRSREDGSVETPFLRMAAPASPKTCQ